MDNSLFKEIFKGDKVLWALYIALVVISLFVTFSALAKLSISQNSTVGPIVGHWMTIGVGLVIVCLIQLAPFAIIKKMGYFLLLIGVLGVAYVMYKGSGVGDAARHTSVGQPSEVLMLGLILVSAGLFNTFSTNRKLEERYFYYVASIIMLCVFMIFVDNLSTAALATIAVVSMMLVGGISVKRIAKFFAVIALFLALFVSVSYLFKDKADFERYASEHKYMYVFRRAYTWRARVDGFFDDDKEENVQVREAKIAICYGGWLPNGPSTSNQRYRLAEAYTDFIFSIAAEEGGFLLGSIIMLIYIGVFWRAVLVVRREQRLYRILLVTGCAVLIVTQAAVHIGVSVGAIPVTGQPLPIISKGGSSVVVISACFGIIAKVSAEQKDEQALQQASSDQSQEQVEEELEA